MNRIREAFQDHMLLIVAVAMLLNGFLQVQVMRQQRDIQGQQRDFMEVWAKRVGVIAEWQGPTQMQTNTERDGAQFALTMQQARSADDVDVLIQRMQQGLRRMKGVPNAR